MNSRFVIYLLGWLLLMEAGFVCVPLATAAMFRESIRPYVLTIMIAVIAGAALVRFFRPNDRRYPAS